MLSNINSIGFEFESNIFPFIKKDNLYIPIFPNVNEKTDRYRLEDIYKKTEINIINDKLNNLNIKVTADIEEPDEIQKIAKKYKHEKKLHPNCVLFGTGYSIVQPANLINKEYYLHIIDDYNFIVPLIDISDTGDDIGQKGYQYFLPNYELHSLFMKKINNYEMQDYYYFVTYKMWEFIASMDVTVLKQECGNLIIAKKMCNEEELLFVLYSDEKTIIDINKAKKLLYMDSIINVQASMCIKYEFTYELFKQLLKKDEYKSMAVLEILDFGYIDEDKKFFLNFCCLYLYYINIFFITNIKKLPKKNKKKNYTRRKITFRKKFSHIIKYLFDDNDESFKLYVDKLKLKLNLITDVNHDITKYIIYVNNFFVEYDNIIKLLNLDEEYELYIYGNIIECGDTDNFMFELRNVEDDIKLDKYKIPPEFDIETSIVVSQPKKNSFFDIEDEPTLKKRRIEIGGCYSKYIKYLNKNIDNIKI